ncbi:uncharacterized protein [Diadema antillarum]|uniref:uncharacterized protein n=1 Tax=Diadema antillarum TaxID=105358 RepID=UPI003A8AEFE4
MAGVNVTPDFSLGESIVSRQTLDAIVQLNNFECSVESSTTGMTETCSFGEVAATAMNLGVTPFINDVMVGQTARFSCDATARASGDEIISFSWSLFKDGNQVDLGQREKGFMKQNMRILDAEMSDDNLLVVCTARSLLGLTVQGAGTLHVHQLTSSSETVTTQMVTSRDHTITASPQGQAALNTIIISVIVALLFVIAVLFIIILFLAKSKSNRSYCFLFRRDKRRPNYRPSAARLTESDCQPYDQAIFLDQNPDIIRGHSSSIPMYAIPDKLKKASTLDGGARYSPRHYVPRRETYGGSGASESEFWRQATARTPDQPPNPYENIDSDDFKDSRQFRTKSHTVSQVSRAPNTTSSASTARTYRGMKSASSLSTLYTKPEKPPRKISLRNRKSWDMPGSIENLCNSATADRHSVKSLTTSICEGDSYACIVDDNVNFEDNTTMSEYMDMRSIPDVSMDQYMNDLTGESDLSPVNDTPVYAEVKK